MSVTGRAEARGRQAANRGPLELAARAGFVARGASKTDAAVCGFQQALAADIPSMAVAGIVGPITWQALISGMLSF
jgi:hypothetical protein